MTTDKNAHTSLNSSIGCIIMASGEGKRFGGNKLMADFCGKPLIAHIISTAQNVFENIVVVTRHKDVELLCRKLDVAVVHHDLPYLSDTVKLGLEYLGRNFDGYIFCQGDQPLLGRETLHNMINEFEKDKEKIIRLEYDGTPCSPVIFPHWAYDSLANLPRGKGGNVVVKNNADKVVYVSAQHKWETVDVDTKEDLQKLTEYI
jgi:molybdenum cofactor cytidylyltransferase